jgi:DNA-directed RNA polymerase specialized sigma subunit
MSYSGQYADEAQEISDSLDNPWESDKAQALEYIELIGQPWIRKVFYLYYIEGYTIIEVANLYEVPHDRVEKALKHGLEHIKEWITEGTKNKPDPS